MTHPSSRVPDHDTRHAAPPRAPVRVMQIIGVLAQQRDGLSLAQLSEALDLPKTSLFSLLRSLEAGGFVLSEGGHHRLGQETYSLATQIQSIDRFPGNVRHLLIALHKAGGETALVGVPSEDWTQLIYVDVIEADAWLRYSANIGSRRPLYSTSLGLTILAFAPPERRQQYLETARLEPVTHSTITDRRTLQEALQRIQEAGCARSNGSISGATGIAAPIFNASCKVQAAVGIAGPTARFERNAKSFMKMVRGCGEQMSCALGFAGAYPGTLKPTHKTRPDDAPVPNL